MTQEQKDRIDREARNKFQYGGLIRTQSKREGYIAGATAEAERAQVLVDALEQIDNSPIPYTSNEVSFWMEAVRKLVHEALEALQKWGKEVEG